MIRVRRGSYRDRDGFTITGTSPRGHRISIFTLTESSARHIADKVRAGQDIESADFEAQP